MEIKLLGHKINYHESGQEEKNAIILIHGWGENHKHFNKLITDLNMDYHVYALDLPGFGHSSKLIKVYGTNDYSKIILEFIKTLKIKSPILLGHSLGGKIIIDLLTKELYNPKKIILIDTAGITKKYSFKRLFKIYKYKIHKKLILTFNSYEKAKRKLDLLRRKTASSDYKNASGILRDTLIKITNENYKKYLKEIKVDTLLIWGLDDTETPINDAYIMKKEIKNSKLKIIENCGHFPLLTNYNETLEMIITFLNE